MRRTASQDVKNFYRLVSTRADGRLAGLSRVPPSPSRRDIARIREPDTLEPGSDRIENELDRRKGARRERTLPLPPFMQGATTLKERLRLRPAAKPVLYAGRNEKTLAENLRDAPFSTAFNLNPYARALAAPVRLCSLTRARLPHSCLLSFHPVTSEEADQQIHELLPLSLAAELVPRNKSRYRRTEEENLVTEEWEQESRSAEPTGIASYLLNSKKTLSLATKESVRNKKAILTEKLVQRLGSAVKNVKWRSDMPDFVLAALRRVAMKKLRFIFNSKTSLMLDKPGMIYEPPGGRDLSRLRDADGVACVLRLKDDEPIAAEGQDESVQRDENTDKQSLSEKDGQEELSPFSGVGATPEGEPLTSFRFKDNPNKKAALKIERDQTKEGLKKGGQFKPKPKPKNDRKKKPTDINETGVLNLRPSGKQQARQTLYNVPGEQDEETIGVTVDSHASDQAYWAAKEEAGLSLSLVKPQQGPRKPAPSFYETVHYRNRRVPLYNLPRLLGKENVQSLLEKSAFKNSKWVILAYSTGTVDAQIWLLKLQAYLAEETLQEAA